MIAAVGLAASLSVAPSALASPRVAPTTPPNSRGPLLWTAPAPVDAAPIDAIACPAVSLCVAADRNGGVLWSKAPAGGRFQWHRAYVDGSLALTGLSCPAATLCVAVDAAGNAVTSTNPAGGGSAWTVTHIDSSVTQSNTDGSGALLLRGVSCPSTTLCVAVDAAGNAMISTNPTGGTGAWGPIHIDSNTSFDCSGTALSCQPPLVGIACPSVAECVAIDFSGNVLTTGTPTVATPWANTPVDGGGLNSLWGITCPTTGLCAAVDGISGHVITFNPAGVGGVISQTSRSLPYSLGGIWCESQSLCLASAQSDGGLSGLVGSSDPANSASTWSLQPVGGVNAVACLGAGPVCLAADDEGNIAAGATTTSIAAALSSLATGHLPTIAALDTTHQATLMFTSPIAGQLTLTWKAPGTAGGTPMVVASATHAFTAPGTAPLTLDLTAAGQRLFAAATRSVRLSATATFTAQTGSISSVRALTFRHPPRPPKRRHHK